jgi:hypothetical protein
MTVLEGNVQITSETVPGRTYTVTLRACGHDSCPCGDFQFRNRGDLDYKCKHIRKARGLAS